MHKPNPNIERLIAYLEEEGDWIPQSAPSGDTISTFGLKPLTLEWPVRRGRILIQKNTYHGGRPAYGLPGFKPLPTFEEDIYDLLERYGETRFEELIYLTTKPCATYQLRSTLQEMRSKGVLKFHHKHWAVAKPKDPFGHLPPMECNDLAFREDMQYRSLLSAAANPAARVVPPMPQPKPKEAAKPKPKPSKAEYIPGSEELPEDLGEMTLLDGFKIVSVGKGMQ